MLGVCLVSKASKITWGFLFAQISNFIGLDSF
jgi:hypothetical protein